jgi:hypothetical protein
MKSLLWNSQFVIFLDEYYSSAGSEIKRIGVIRWGKCVPKRLALREGIRIYRRESMVV